MSSRFTLFMARRGTNALPYRTVQDVLTDWRIQYGMVTPTQVRTEGSSCVECGLPLCRSPATGGCPLANPINRWHQLIRDGRMLEAWRELEGSNPLPEMMIACPAPCMNACTAHHHFWPIGIKPTEQGLWDWARKHRKVRVPVPECELGISVGIVGSGPAGLAAAYVLRLAGFTVHVFEASRLFGGLLMEGIPNFHLEKYRVLRRVALLRRAGVHFHSGIVVGSDEHPLDNNAQGFDVVLGDERIFCDYLLLGLGAKQGREINIPGRQLRGIHQAMDFLVAQNHVDLGLIDKNPIDVEGHDLICIGGGLTGLDVRSTTLRRQQRAELTVRGSATTLVRKPRPNEVESAHRWHALPDSRMDVVSFREGGETMFGTRPLKFLDNHGDGNVTHIRGQLLTGEITELPATRVLLSLGFLGPGTTAGSLPEQLGLAMDHSGFIEVEDTGLYHDHASRVLTSDPRVFAIGDCTTNPQRLIVDAAAAGRDAARHICKQHDILW